MLRLQIPYLSADAFSVVRRKHRVAGFAPGLAGIGKASGIEKKESVLHFQKGPVGVAEEHALQIPGARLIQNTGKIHGYSKHYIDNALIANVIMQKDVNYLVMDDEIIIVDEFTGRQMIGRRFSNGLHQAIEAKEGVKIRSEDKTLATITFQNLFRQYRKLSGMTGTAKTEENEFEGTYNLDVVVIPTNKPVIRVDEDDLLYVNEKAKFRAIIEEIRKCHERRQPVLVGTVSVEKSEKLSEMLKRAGLKNHNVLNARYYEREAEIVAQAGKPGAITISTNMAGRGTNIMLGGNPEHLA